MQNCRFGLSIFAASLLFAGVAAAATGPAPAADAATSPAQATAAPASAGAAQQPNSQFSVMQQVGDWVVRCVQVTVKSTNPCEMTTVGIDQNKQPRTQFTIAYVPSRDAYFVQIIVPPGAALARGLTLAAGDHSLNNAKFNRCERNGCYVELLSDAATLSALQGMGKASNITWFPYGGANQSKWTVSLTGFPDALDRMKSYARDRAVAAPTQPGAAPAAAPAKAAPKGRAARAPAGAATPAP